MRNVFIMIWIVALAGCKTTQQTTKSDAEFDKAVKESEQNKSKKLDFLANEKLPNEEFKDSVQKDESEIKLHPIDYSEIPPDRPAKFRVQIFAGSVSNAHKNYSEFVRDHQTNEVYLVNDKIADLWKVWVGNYNTKADADTAKQRLLKEGYPDSWVHEMKGDYAPKENLFWVQIGNFQSESSAQNLKNDVSGKQKENVVIRKSDNLWKVWMGGYADRTAADNLKTKMLESGYKGAFVVKGNE